VCYVGAMDEEETTHWAIRIPLDLADRVTLVQEQVAADQGFPVSRTSALKMLIKRGLEDYRKGGRKHA
jgi:hypothetical protein